MSRDEFVVLAVCTGNVCRSPAIERLLLAEQPAALRVSSAGTHALVGAPMDPLTAEEVARAGGDPAGFVARQLTAAMVREADLVVTAEPRHRSAVVAMVPVALRRTFTLLELVRVARPVPAGDDLADARRRLVATAAESRAADASREAVPDPFGAPAKVHQRAVGAISPAVRALARLLDSPVAPRSEEA